MSNDNELQSYRHITRKLGKASAATDIKNTVGLELAPVLVSLLSGGKTGYDISKEIRRSLQPDETLGYSVLDTRTTADDHQLLIEFSNHSRHGLYLERIQLKDPDAGDLTVKRHITASNPRSLYTHHKSVHERDIGFPATKRRDDSVDLVTDDKLLPVFLAPGQELRARVILPLFDKFRMQQKPHGKLAVYYCVAGEGKGEQKKEVGFSVRGAAG